jgi:hypothetical protein
MSPTLLPEGETFLGDPLPFANPSEVSSGWIPLPLLAVAVLVILWALVSARRPAAAPDTAAPDTAAPDTAAPDRQHRPPLWTGVLSAAVTLLLLAWMLLPVPHLVGAVTLLDRVTGRRMPVALTLAAAVELAIGMTAARRIGRPRWLWLPVAIGAAGTVAITVWAVAELPWQLPEQTPPSREVAAIALVLALGAGLLLLGRLPRTAAAGLGLLALVTYLPVNPVYHGLGALDRDPVVRALTPMVKADQGLRAVVYGHSSQLTPLVTASGAQTLSGLTIYPDAEVWQQLAPDQEQGNWNQNSKYDWIADPTIGRPTLRRVSGTQQNLIVDPCSAQIRRLDIDVSLSPDPINVPCLRLDTAITRRSATIYVYRYR